VSLVAARAATYYVSPRGDDSKLGTAAATAWKTCGKVNGTAFQPGDAILFERGGQWREALRPTANGATGKPITFDAYGKGAKPILWGSDVLTNANFTPAGGNTYNYNIPNLPAGVVYALQNHQFIGTGPVVYNNPTLTIASGTDPRTDGKLYTVCARGNVIFNNFRDHLVFRNLVVDETAGEPNDGNNQGYGIRIQGCTDVIVEDCEAYRCGRHNVGIINATGFIGRRIIAGYAAPSYPGDNSIYVSYADAGAPVAKCEHQWIDCVSDHAENGQGGFYAAFQCHGDHQGRLTFTNFHANSLVALQLGPATMKGGVLSRTARLSNWGADILVDGMTFKDKAFMDQWASGGTFQNCVFENISGQESGCFLFRAGVGNNTVRFCTIVAAGGQCMAFYGPAPGTQWYGNIMLGAVTYQGNAADVAYADYNFYGNAPTIMGQAWTAWQAAGKDAHSLTGDPGFVNAAAGDYHLAAASPCIDHGTNRADVAWDHDGVRRPASGHGPAVSDIGAYEFSGGRAGAAGRQTGTATSTGTKTGRR
jgi:hypothetical protein